LFVNNWESIISTNRETCPSENIQIPNKLLLLQTIQQSLILKFNKFEGSLITGLNVESKRQIDWMWKAKHYYLGPTKHRKENKGAKEQIQGFQQHGSTRDQLTW